MTLWPLFRSAIYAGLGVAEVAVSVYERAQQLGRRLLPRRREDAGATLRRLRREHRDRETTIRPPAMR